MYNKRLRSALPLVKRIVRDLARDSDFWFDNHWIVDSTPVPCGMSRLTVKRSDQAGRASYGYCASHSRLFWCFASAEFEAFLALRGRRDPHRPARPGPWSPRSGSTTRSGPQSPAH